ncbi:MAG TPA: hydrogenase maturation protease [Candidatus Sulfotelmatobacter sp.]|nr:hydrogenase maturation protease [Candidatus Sulfotelmatobacter sp.]
MLILGCGNRDRGDDAAGVLVAERLRALGIPAQICSGSSALMDAWSEAPDVLVIDCVVTGSPAGTVHAWAARHLPPLARTSASTHGFGLREAIELSRALGCLPARLRIYGIEGINFAIGSSLSKEVQEAVERVAARIAIEGKEET